MNIKKEKMKARGIRFTDEQWALLQKLSKQHECTPSDIVRHAIEKMIKKKSPKK